MLALVSNFMTRPSSYRLASRLKSFSGLIDDDFSQKPKVVKKSRKVIKPMDYESLPRVVNTKRTSSDVLFIQPRRKKKAINQSLLCHTTPTGHYYEFLSF